ncbi:MAG: hypothetical protein R3Y27_04720 [Clostridia bacterium]
MKKRVLSLMIVAALVFLCGCSAESEVIEVEAQYEAAVVDAMLAEESEVYDLVVLDAESDMVTFNDDNEVLLVTWNKYPDSYPEGEVVELVYGSIWVFTDKEILAWYEETEGEISDYQLRLNQLIGLPADDDNTHFTAMWVDIDDVIRPAYFTDAESSEMDIENYDMESDFETWFNSNIISSYYSEYQYPWTRLGYTYDWCADSDEYGLTEFLVKENSQVTVEFTMTTEEFIAYMQSELAN